MTRAQILANRVELLASQLQPPEKKDLLVIMERYTKAHGGASTMHMVARLSRRQETLKKLLEERIRLEREVGLAPEDEDTWHGDLVASVHEIVDRQGSRLYRELEEDSRRFLRQSADLFLDQVKQGIEQLRKEALWEADIMKGERTHNVRVPTTIAMAPGYTINIKDSQIASLNFGVVVGQIQATVNALKTRGEEKIAEALKTLAEAIGNESSMPAKKREDSLQLVSAIGDELARPAEERRYAVLRSAAETLKSIALHFDKVYAAYEILKTLVRASMGTELP
jgi:hypothetical protein